MNAGHTPAPVGEVNALREQVQQLREQLNQLGDIAYRAGAGDPAAARDALAEIHRCAKRAAHPG